MKKFLLSIILQVLNGSVCFPFIDAGFKSDRRF